MPSTTIDKEKLERGVLECLASGWSLRDTALEMEVSMHKLSDICQKLMKVHQVSDLNNLRLLAEQQTKRSPVLIQTAVRVG